MKIKHILWASDGSKESCYALRWTELCATRLGANVTALSVVENPDLCTLEIPDDVTRKIALIDRGLERRTDNRLKRLGRVLEQKGIKTETRVVIGIPYQEIIKAAQSHDVWMRLAGINRMADDPDGAYARDVADQFDRVRSLADGESQFLFGIIELYQTKVHTKMTVAMERLAVIAAVTLPVTALASIYGMNVIVNDSTHWSQLIVILVVMLTISSALLVWARRQGWW